MVDVGDYLVVLDLLQGDRPVRDASAAAVLHDVAERARRLVPPRGEIRSRGTDSDDPLGVGERTDPGRIEVVLPDADRVTAMLWAQSLVGYVAARVGRGGLPEETALRSQVHDTTGPVGLGVVRELTGPERSEGVVGNRARPEDTAEVGEPVAGSGSVSEGPSNDAEPVNPLGTAGSAASAGAASAGEASAGAVSAGGALAGPNGSHAVQGRHGGARDEERRAVNGAAGPEASAVADDAASADEFPGPIDGSTDVAGPADVAESSDAALSTPGTGAIDVAGSTGAVGSADAAGSTEADAVPGRHGGQVPWSGAATVQPGSGGRRRRDSSTSARTEERPDRLAAVAVSAEAEDRQVSDTMANGNVPASGGTTATDGPAGADDASGTGDTGAAPAVTDAEPVAGAGRAVVAGARPRRVGPDEERAARVARHAAQRRSRTAQGTDRSADGSEGNGSGPAVDGGTSPAADAGNADRVRAVDPTDIPDDLGMAELLAGALAAYRDI